MLVCMNCNVEYEEDRRFCKHCGNPLVPKVEPISTQKKVDRTEGEKSDRKLICPNCKIIYEFGSSCIQCGSALVTEILPKEKEALETDHKKPGGERDRVQVQKPQEQQIKKLPKNLICPTCKIIYERGDSCIKCGAALVPQIPPRTKEEPRVAHKPEAEEKPVQLQTIQEQMTEAPRKKLICPTCKIIYERGNSCVRCGSALVTQIPAQEEKKPELPEETEVKKEELEVAPTPEEEVKEEHPQTQIPEQEPTKKRGEDFERRISLPKKRKRDYRRLFREAGGITIMVVAGGYFLWAIYSHLLTRPLEPKIAASKEVTSQVIPNSPPPTHPATSVTESEESKYKKTEESSSISKEVTSAVPASPSLPDTSKMFLPEMQEIENIKALLENIRQANLQKNIDLFISCYATDFKDREGKKKATQAYWKKFDYLDLSYDFKNPSISGDTAKARVEWLIKISPQTGGQPQESKTILDVTLKKEEGGGKIKEVKQGG